MSADELLLPGEVADIMRVAVGTLTQWRFRKVGPKYIKIEGQVRYLRSEVEKWLQEQARTTGAAS